MLIEFARDLRQCGIGTFLHTDGELLVAHGHKRHHADGSLQPPGLHFLCRHCRHEPSATLSADGLRLASDREEQDVVLVASVPLTKDEGWVALTHGEVLVAAKREALSRTELTYGV